MHKIYTDLAKDSYKNFGEEKLIQEAIKIYDASVLPAPYGSGDDCALIKSKSLRENVFVTTDSVIAGVHFDLDDSPQKVGGKLINRNASDIAAMGGNPKYAQTSVIVCPKLSVKWVRGFLKGMKIAADKLGIKFIGGDLASVKHDFFSAHLTLIGESNTSPLLRTGAEVGDFLFITGKLGASYESKWHLEFLPRIEQGNWLALQKEVKSAIDITDGIARDLPKILPKNACAILNSKSIPIKKIKNNTLDKAMCDGEDYELLFTVSGEATVESFKKKYFKEFKTEVFYIGKIVDSNSFDLKKISKSKSKIFLMQNGIIEPYMKKAFSH